MPNLEAYEAVKERVGDDPIAPVLLQELAKDARVAQMKKERTAGQHQADSQLATPKQIAYLQSLGVDVPENLSKQEASAMLDQALAGNTGHVPVIRVTRRVP